MKKVALFIAIVLLSAISAYADAVITVGTAADSTCLPFSCNESFSSTSQSIEYQQVYSTSAFTGPLSFNAITFYDGWTTGNFDQGGPLIPGTYDISFYYASPGAVDNLSTNLAANEGAALGTFVKLTVNNPISFSSTTDSLTIDGSTIDYNPANGALLMDVIVTSQADIPNWDGNGYFDSTGASTATSMAYDVSGSSATGSFGLVTGFVDPPPSVPEPATALLGGAGILGIAVAGQRRLNKKA